jgi:hypothetical protein
VEFSVKNMENMTSFSDVECYERIQVEQFYERRYDRQQTNARGIGRGFEGGDREKIDTE